MRKKPNKKQGEKPKEDLEKDKVDEVKKPPVVIEEKIKKQKITHY